MLKDRLAELEAELKEINDRIDHSWAIIEKLIFTAIDEHQDHPEGDKYREACQDLEFWDFDKGEEYRELKEGRYV